MISASNTLHFTKSYIYSIQQVPFHHNQHWKCMHIFHVGLKIETHAQNQLSFP